MGTATSPEEQAVFGYSPRLAGFYRVALWLREVNVSRTSADPLELTDRGVWFNGIAEDWDAFPAPRRRLQSQ
jgi:hypothetical protein